MSEQPNPHALFLPRNWYRQLLLLTVFLLADFPSVGNAQAFDGRFIHNFSLEWNGSSFQVNGFPGQAFPNLNLYENHYYVFENNSSNGAVLSIAENNHTSYGKPDLWNKLTLMDEYSLFVPDSNTTRTLYYFNPDLNASTGQLTVLPYDSSLIRPNLSLDDSRFGHALQVNDWNQTIVGAPGQGTLDGALYIFDRETNGSLTQRQIILPATVDGQLGASLDVDAEFLVAGAPDESGFQGKAYIYKRESNGSYLLLESHAAPLPTIGDSFGWGLAIDGSRMLIASLQRENSGSGKVNYYQKNVNDTWSFLSSFSSDDNQSGDEFGHDLDLDGGHLIVGSPLSDGDGNNSGAAYIYEFNGSNWTQTQKLAPASLSVDDKFGYSVALSGNIAFVGAVNGDSNVSNTGCVYVFEKISGVWTEQAKIVPPNLTPNQLFSSNLDVFDNLLMVAAPQAGEDGFAYIYRMDGNSSQWNLRSSLDCKAALSANQDVTSISITNGMAVMGNPGDSSIESFGGGVLVFYNDAWKNISLPELRPLIDGNSTPVVHFLEVEDQNYSVLYSYDLNGSHPFSTALTWSVDSHDVIAGQAQFELNSSSGLLSYRPDGNFSGIHTFTVSLNLGALSDTVQLSVIVDGTPDGPIFTGGGPNPIVLPNAMEGDEYNQTISIFDADGDALTLTHSGSPPTNFAIIGSNITFTPLLGSAGAGASQTYSFDLNVSDGNTTSSSVQSFRLTVLDRNEPPFIEVNGSRVVKDINVTIPEDCNASNWYSLLPTLSYGDPDGHQIELNASLLPTYGTVTLNKDALNNQSVLYIPNQDFNGTDIFTIRLNDVQGMMNKFAEVTFNITVLPINDPPVITSVPPGNTASEGNLFSYQLTYIDPDVGDSVSIGYSNLPSWLGFNPLTNVFSGTPTWSDYEESGPRLVVIDAIDQSGAKGSQAFLLEVVPSNYPPRINQGGSISVQINEDSLFSDWPSSIISATDQDATSGQLTWVLATDPLHGDAVVSGVGNQPDVFHYKPDGNYTGSDSFVIKVYDSGDPNAEDSILVQVSILPIDDAPVFKTTTAGIAVKDFLFEYNATAFDADGQESVVITVLSPLPSWVTFVDEGNGSARFSGTPGEFDVGQNLIVVECRDSTNLFSQQVFTLKVIKENTNPIISQGSSISFSATEDTTWVGDGLLTATDPDWQDLYWSVSVNPVHGTVFADGTGGSIDRLEYIPDANYSGADSFEIRVSDGVGSTKIVVNLDVQNVEDAPVFSVFPVSQSIVDGNLLNLSLVVYDADGLSAMMVTSALPSWLTLDSSSLSTNGSILIYGTAAVPDEGQHTVTVTATDSTGLSISRSLVLTVEVHNYPPSINGTAFNAQMTEDLPATWTAPALSATDLETSPVALKWSVSQAPLRGTASFGTETDPSTLTYLPDANFSGTDLFVVSVTDGGGIHSSPPKSDSANISVNVAAVNDLPVFTSVPTTDKIDGTYSWNDESEYVYKVIAYDSDWDWQSLELNVTSVLPDWLTFLQDGNGTGTLRGTGAVKDKGTYLIEFTATDSNGTTARQVFDLVLRIDNYPPVFKNLKTNEEITELIVYLDEDSEMGGIRGWVKPEDFFGEDPDPELQVPPRDLTWSLGSLPLSLAHAEVNGTGLRPQVFTYRVVPNYFGTDLFHLRAFDGHRYAQLPVRVQVRPVPDPPSFSSLVPTELYGKVGSLLSVPLITQDPDGDSRKIEVVGLPRGEEGFWLGISDMNQSSGTASLRGVPPRGIQGKVYPVVLIVTDSTGRYATVNTKLIIDGENRSPVINGPESVQLTFDQFGKSKASDLASILARDLDGDTLTWSLSPLSGHKYGLPEVGGTGPRPSSLTYTSYGSQTADPFVIRVSDAESYDELTVIPVVVNSHSAIQVGFPSNHDSVESGTSYSNYFSLAGLSDYTVIDATLVASPSWLRISKVSQGLFRLHGFVPSGLSGDFELQVHFSEAGIEKARQSLVLKVTSSSVPSLSLLGDDFVRLRKGGLFSDPGYQAKGSGGEDLSGSVVFQGETTATTVGTKRLQYKVSDPPTGSEVSSFRFLQVSESNSTVVVSSLTSLDPSTVKGILPMTGNTLTWGEGKNGQVVSGNSNAFAFLSTIDSNGTSLAVGVFESLAGQEVKIENCISLTDGCLLVAGLYKGNLSYGSYRLAAKGSHNAFIMKLDSTLGLIWSKTFSSAGVLKKLKISEFSGSDILFGGSFSGSLSSEAGIFSSVGGDDLFVARMDSTNGMVSWFKRYGGAGDDSTSALQSEGELIYLAGGVNKTGQAEYSFVFELDGTGTVLNSSSFKEQQGNQIVQLVTGGGRIYILGRFESSIQLAGKSLSSPGSSAFALSLKTGLIHDWSSGIASQIEPLALETDAFGFPVFLSRFTNTSTIEGTALNLNSIGQSDLLLAKLNKTNGTILWHKQLGGVGDENSTDLKTDLHGKIHALIHTDQSFTADGLDSGAGRLLLASVESLQKPSFSEIMDLNLTKGKSFHQMVHANAPMGFAQMELMHAPSWVYLKDDRNGSAIIGGTVHPDANESTDFIIRAFDSDGGYADLNVSCSISENNKSMGASNQFPSFSKSVDLGSNVILSNVSDCGSGKYFVCGKFTDKLSVGTQSAISVTGYDGFALKIDAQGGVEDLLHLASDGDIIPVSSTIDDEGTIHLTGYFSGKISVGYLEIESAGQNDIFLLSWSKKGNLLTLQSIGGSGDERSTSLMFLDGALVLCGYFTNSFNYGRISEQSVGGTDAFVMSVDVFDFQQINWFKPLVGSSDDKVNVLELSTDGSFYIGGSFGSSAIMDGVEIVSNGLSDAFVGKLKGNGKVEFLSSGGGLGKDEISFLGTAQNGNLLIGGNFSELFLWDSHNLSSKGGKDIFLATLSTTGNCLSLVGLGGSGTEEIRGFVLTSDSILVLGSFNGSIDLGLENPFLSRGGMDSFVAFYDHDLKPLRSGVRFGAEGDDILLGGASVFEGNYLLAGVSNGRLGVNLGYDLSGSSQSSSVFLSVYGPASFSPMAWPEPPVSAIASSYFEYHFNSGPWPVGASLDLTVRSLPSFLRAELGENGSGVIWGMVPGTLDGGASSFLTDLSVQSKLYGKAEVTFSTSLVSSAETFHLVSNSTSHSIAQFEKFSTIIRIIGARPQDIIVYPETLPSWITGIRLNASSYLLEGTPSSGHSGLNSILLRATSKRFESAFSLDLSVQSSLGNSSLQTTFGKWRQSWFGALIVFGNSWAYHRDLGWIYIESSKDGGSLWFWTEKWGWTWTNQSHWNSQLGEGFLYSFKTGSWLYFKDGLNGSSDLVFLYETSQWDFYNRR